MSLCRVLRAGHRTIALLKPATSSAMAAHAESCAASSSAIDRGSVCGIACNVYVSEGSDEGLLAKLKEVASSSDGAHPYSFVDAPYGRSSYTFVAKDPSRLAQAVGRVAGVAARELRMDSHAASHPRLGIVDHISCHPIGDAGSSIAVEAAHRVGEEMSHMGFPVYFYGLADRGRERRLRDVRRAMGYFKGASGGEWSGSLPGRPTLDPDMGGLDSFGRLGACLVGATPWVTNYNMALEGCGWSDARQLATAVSERGGGLQGVEAMALRHHDTIEIACNILDAAVSPIDAVASAIREGASKMGVSRTHGYRIGLTIPELESALQAL